MILLLLKTIVVAYALKSLGEFIGELLLTSSEKIINYWGKLGMYLVSYLLSCNKCFAFWTSLILSGDLLIAGLTSIIIAFVGSEHFKLLKYE